MPAGSDEAIYAKPLPLVKTPWADDAINYTPATEGLQEATVDSTKGYVLFKRTGANKEDTDEVVGFISLLDVPETVVSDAVKDAISTKVVEDLINSEGMQEILGEIGEPDSGAPPLEASVAEKISYLYSWARNKSKTTASKRVHFADDGTTPMNEFPLSENSTTFTKGEAKAP